MSISRGSTLIGVMPTLIYGGVYSLLQDFLPQLENAFAYPYIGLAPFPTR